jgi:hypothetical protein
LTLTLAPAPNGGSLLLHADLGALAFAQAWIDGPCNSQGSLISVTAKGKGTLDGNETVTFTFPPGRIDLDSQETVALDQASLQTAFGGAAWPFDPVKDAILNWAIRSGTINLGASYSEEDKFRLIDLSKLNLFKGSKVFQRVGKDSLLIGFEPDLKGTT